MPYPVLYLRRHTMQKILHHAIEVPAAHGILVGTKHTCDDSHALSLPNLSINSCQTLFERVQEISEAQQLSACGIYYASPTLPWALEQNTHPLLYLFYWIALDEKGVMEIRAWQKAENHWQPTPLQLTSQ